MRAPYKLKNQIQEYSWGSKTLMPELLGRENSDERPFAEMWMGVHPRGPSAVEEDGGESSLASIIDAYPEELLGDGAARRFSGNLPFLFKVLAAGQPLSIQTHPNKEQAEEGYSREEREGIPVDAFHRNYRDRNHKPEVICALTPFTAMCGFRSLEELRSGFSLIDSEVVREKLLPALDGRSFEARGAAGPRAGADAGTNAVAASRKETDTEAQRLESFFESLMALGEEETGELVRALVAWAGKNRSTEASLVRRFYDLHGFDRGVAAPFYLNVITLAEGEALFQPAGVLHAYVEGMGVELMANSDNVLRGGLTKKHVDVEELLSLLSFSPRTPDVIQPQEVSPGIEEYPVPIDEFLLRRIRPHGVSSSEGLYVENRSSIEIGICVSGSARIAPSGAETSEAEAKAKTSGGGAAPLEIEKGESFVLPYAMGAYRISGDAVIYLATIPLAWP